MDIEYSYTIEEVTDLANREENAITEQALKWWMLRLHNSAPVCRYDEPTSVRQWTVYCGHLIRMRSAADKFVRDPAAHQDHIEKIEKSLIIARANMEYFDRLKYLNLATAREGGPHTLFAPTKFYPDVDVQSVVEIIQMHDPAKMTNTQRRDMHLRITCLCEHSEAQAKTDKAHAEELEDTIRSLQAESSKLQERSKTLTRTAQWYKRELDRFAYDVDY